MIALAPASFATLTCLVALAFVTCEMLAICNAGLFSVSGSSHTVGTSQMVTSEPEEHTEDPAQGRLCARLALFQGAEAPAPEKVFGKAVMKAFSGSFTTSLPSLESVSCV